MRETKVPDGFDRTLDDVQSLNDGSDPEAGKNARQKLIDSLAVDDTQAVLSDVLASGLDALFGWLSGS